MAKRGFDPRRLMEMAIEVMRSSIHEPRDDGKVCPMVGAALRKGDGTVETSCRCELRYGDHAEYTLLERKNRDQKLDDAFLFTTLEPAPRGRAAIPNSLVPSGLYWPGSKKSGSELKIPIPQWIARGSSTCKTRALPFACLIATFKRRFKKRTKILFMKRWSEPRQLKRRKNLRW